MKYIHYLYSICLVVFLLLSTLFHPLAQADSFRVGFENINGHGVYADIVKINNIRVEILNPFDKERALDTIYYDLHFKVCDDFEGKRVSLQPSLTEEEILCPFTNGFDFHDSFVTLKGYNSMTLEKIHTPRGDCTINFNFNEDTLFFNQTNSCIPTNIVHDISIYLKWQAPLRDLDAHLTGPNCDNCDANNRFHLYFSNRQNNIARLHATEFSDGQPESIHIYPAENQDRIRAGLYRFTVHHFAGRDSNLSNSNVGISAWICDWEQNCEEKMFLIPPNDDNHLLRGEGDTWTALEFIIAPDGRLENIWAPNEYHVGIHPNDVW